MGENLDVCYPRQRDDLSMTSAHRSGMFGEKFVWMVGVGACIGS